MERVAVERYMRWWCVYCEAHIYGVQCVMGVLMCVMCYVYCDACGMCISVVCV